MMKNEFLSWVLMASGVYSIIASVTNWDWFFENRRARDLTQALGRDTARAIHLGLGLLCLLGGAYLRADLNSAPPAPGELRDLRTYSPRGE